MNEDTEYKVYPDLSAYPVTPVQPVTPVYKPQDFRLTQITDVRKFLEDEMEFRRKIRKKYKKAFNVVTGIGHAVNITSVVAGAVGVSSLAGVITAPIGIALGGVSIGCAVLSSGLSCKKKDILHKLAKHENIGMLAVSKLNTINSLVSKAISDSHISEEEFTLIIKEKEKYSIMKNGIRKKQRETVNNSVDVEQLKRTFLEEGKKQAQNEMIEKLKKQ